MPHFDRHADGLTPNMLVGALAGDPQDVVRVFAEDVRFEDLTVGETLNGREEVREHFAQFMGRRATARVLEIASGDDRFAVRYAIEFSADAHRYVQHGTAWITVADGRIVDWVGVWSEASS